MTIFDYEDTEALGGVQSVDTATVVVRVEDIERLRQMQVNRLVVLQSSRPGQHLVGIVQKITRTSSEPDGTTSTDVEANDEAFPSEMNLVRIALIGTHIDRLGQTENVFRRTLETVPEIEARCFAVEGDRLTAFMRVIADVGGEGQRLSLGHYSLDDNAEAFLNGNRFFQRHAIIVGSTGAGKSWTTARILEQLAELPLANAIVFDIHGEYGPLSGDRVHHYRVAGPGDIDSGDGIDQGVIYLPYWMLDYESLISMFVDRSDQNAPNQAMVIARTVTDAKRNSLEAAGQDEVLDNFTIDSPVPFEMTAVTTELERLNTEMVPGSGNREKQGDFHGRLSRMISRLENKISDRRLGFLFKGPGETNNYGWLSTLGTTLLTQVSNNEPAEAGGLKIIDFSDVPSDILPLIVSLVARVVFSVQQWTLKESRHPVALFCDEAHLYLPRRQSSDSGSDISIGVFERIAKEGRKYGVGLVVISQRPAEVNLTVLSQCNNLVAMRLTNAEDQAVIRRTLPDSLGSYSDLLPVLDTGEALVVGDANLLPSRVRIAEPAAKPTGGTVNFWDHWKNSETTTDMESAVANWRNQHISR